MTSFDNLLCQLKQFKGLITSACTFIHEKIGMDF